MSAVLDPVSDRNLTLFHRFNQLYNLPDFVKQASANTIDEDEVKTLPSSAFADPVYRQFPCHTKAATALSYIYFLHGANKMSKWAADNIEQRLQQNIDAWCIRAECDELKAAVEKQSADVNTKLPDDCFAIVEKYGDQLVKRYPMINSESVKQAAAHLFDNRDKYPYEWRKKAARRVLRKAAQFNTPIPAPHDEYINKCAGFGIGMPIKIAQAIYDRAILLNADKANAPVQERLIKAAKEVLTGKPTTGMLTKTAEFIAMADVITGMHRLYKRGLPTPEEVVYEMTEKTASDLRNTFVQLTTGTAYRREDIEKAAFEPFKMLGEDLIDEIKDPFGGFDIEKAATLLSTLPRNDAALYEKGMKLLNIPSESQLRKAAGLPNDIGEWDADDWENYMVSLGHKKKSKDFRCSFSLGHPQRVG